METADNNSLFMETESMRELNRNELQQVGGAFSCQLNPAPVNWAAVGGAALVGAVRGPQSALLSGAGAFLGQAWI
ncbi:hypothetical protein LGN04_00005 [Burkholderia multivorans]|uniref:Uncharacterized protein n=2 Tax=Burkholderia multivorans TaxID=87883 RepID=A0AAP2MPW0_9BURK|nr:hypothetical protein [Burkholderia multivorans]EKS9916792.1 hypothetical protein [Burkholderia multivorans]MBU9245466.1 hypothetical protein [Burkholderia multivorans]MBU9358591.1 hypothetical protein [Burkholderia multivorans]MBU9364814.1 hypothetical protein [Burkholderia multivorans]MBU9596357.1 hypothetical protein [Burkholderia multivorans]